MVIYHTMFIPTFCFSGDIQIFLFSLEHFFTPRFLFRSQKDAEFFRPPETKEKDISEDTGYQRETTPTQDLTVNRIHTKFLFS